MSVEVAVLVWLAGILSRGLGIYSPFQNLGYTAELAAERMHTGGTAVRPGGRSLSTGRVAGLQRKWEDRAGDLKSGNTSLIKHTNLHAFLPTFPLICQYLLIMLFHVFSNASVWFVTDFWLYACFVLSRRKLKFEQAQVMAICSHKSRYRPPN